MKIGVAQIRLSNQIRKNLDKIARFSKKASKRKIDILCFPECSVSGYVRDFKKLDFREIEKKIESLKNLVKKEKINIIVGVPFLEKGKLFNGAAVLLKNGKKFIYHKQHLTKFDQKYFSAGKKNLCFRIGNFKCGVAICRDQSYPQIFKNYKKRGVKIVFLLSAHYYLPKEAKLKFNKNKALPTVRALDNKIWIAKANAVGRMRGQVSLGGSLIINPKGYVVKEADQTQETILRVIV